MTVSGCIRGALGAVLTAMVLAGVASAGAAANDEDPYARMVARAEAGDASLDFRALRLAWITSAERHAAPATDDFERQIVAGARANKPADVAVAARRIIAANYIDMGAHKYLRQACKLLGDTACAEHEHFVEFGLLQSITSERDGQSKETAWRVVSIPEEYFIMDMAGMRLTTQALVADGPRQYDRMSVTVDGQPRTVWFDITDFFGHELD
jgi:hypothetical protein